MEKERIVLGDILTPQEHYRIGSTPEFNPTTDEEWYIPDGVLGGRVTLDEAIAEREARGFIESMLDPLGIITRGTSEAMAISLEPIDPETGQTEKDPRILGIVDDTSIKPEPVIDEKTGRPRDLTLEFINYSRKKGLEKDLHLRPGSIRNEGKRASFDEGNTGFRK